MANTTIKQSRQMSEAMITTFFLTLSGGFQDAYTYFVHGGVFANAQTGNIVLMSSRFFTGDLKDGLRYLIPLLFFAIGILLSDQIGLKLKNNRIIHWRQIIVLLEIFILLVVGCIPSGYDLYSNSLVSFACAMQVQAFRKVNGLSYASTMCIGNLRSCMDQFSSFLHTHDSSYLKKSLQYLGVIALFAVGAGIGAILSSIFNIRAIWFSCVLLSIAFILMFKEHDA